MSESLHTANLLPQINRITTGNGFLRDIPIALPSVLCTGTGSPAAAVSSGVIQTTLANSDNLGVVSIKLPADYDSNTRDGYLNHQGDHFELLVDAVATGSDNTLEIGGVKRFRSGDASPQSLTLSAAQTASQAVSATAGAVYSFPLHGLKLQPGDDVHIVLDCTIGGTNIILRGAAIRYRSNLRPTNDADVA